MDYITVSLDVIKSHPKVSFLIIALSVLAISIIIVVVSLRKKNSGGSSQPVAPSGINNISLTFG